MGRSIITRKYEITDEIRELQKLAADAKGATGCEVNVDITQDLVTINGHRKMTRAEAKSYLLELLDPNRETLKITTSTVPDPEEESRKAKEEAKKAKKHREPGAPPVLKALIRRAKRIYKKQMVKGISTTKPIDKAQEYIKRKAANEDDLQKATVALAEYISKETN